MAPRDWLGCVLANIAAITAMAALDPAVVPSQLVPYGCYPARLTFKTNAEELTLSLAGTIPGVSYLVMVRTNEPYATWLPFAYIFADTNTASNPLRINFKSGKAEGLSVLEVANPIPARALCRMQFTAGSGEDTDGDGLPDLYEDLMTRTDPLDPDTGGTGISDGYQDPDGDGWTNLDELRNGTDPLSWNPPPPPSGLSANTRLNPGSRTIGTTTLSWFQNGMVPESFTIMRKPASAPDSASEVVARIKPVPSQYGTYEYVVTNVDTLRAPGYKIYANYPTPPPWVVPRRADSDGVRQTIRQVASTPTTNGYELTVAKCMPHARYLMLVREGKNGFWKASGFFVGSTNRNPIKLIADKRGMMSTTGSPFRLPRVQFVPNLEHPEFIAGSGEDADGDGLPDIYEVLGARTDPNHPDARGTGLLDGYKDLSGDGWTALEKYRRRADPFARNLPPYPIELAEPTLADVMKALGRMKQSDFQFEVRVETKALNSLGDYQPLQQPLMTLFPQMQRDTVAKNLQVRITSRVPAKESRPRVGGGP